MWLGVTVLICCDSMASFAVLSLNEVNTNFQNFWESILVIFRLINYYHFDWVIIINWSSFKTKYHRGSYQKPNINWICFQTVSIPADPSPPTWSYNYHIYEYLHLIYIIMGVRFIICTLSVFCDCVIAYILIDRVYVVFILMLGTQGSQLAVPTPHHIMLINALYSLHDYIQPVSSSVSIPSYFVPAL